MNVSVSFGIANRGAVVRIFFKVWNAASHSSVHRNTLFFSDSAFSGAAISPKPFTNRL
jgi:hypothetical protein